MSKEITTVPNQDIIKVSKEKCDKNNTYTTINLEAMQKAAIDLDAGTFKLWVYLAKNQNNYEFAIGNTGVAETFGIKKSQYDRAKKVLKEKGYLTPIDGNNKRLLFTEVSVVLKTYNEEEIKDSVVRKTNNSAVSKTYNDVVLKTNNPLYEKHTRNITDNTPNNTDNITEEQTKPEEEPVFMF